MHLFPAGEKNETERKKKKTAPVGLKVGESLPNEKEKKETPGGKEKKLKSERNAGVKPKSIHRPEKKGK